MSTGNLYDVVASTTGHPTGEAFQIVYGTGKFPPKSSLKTKGAIHCNVISDTVTFGGISMENFSFGTCVDEYDQTYPQRC